MLRKYGTLFFVTVLCNLSTIYPAFATAESLPIKSPDHVPVQAPQKDEILFLRDNIVVKTKTGDQTFNTEIASSPKQLEQGLMFRKSIGDKESMLFIFNGVQRVAMWMKNTLIPLDMLFIDNSGKIVYIAHDTKPESLGVISSGSAPVRAVLEVKAGTAKAQNIEIGDHVIYKVFEK